MSKPALFLAAVTQQAAFPGAVALAVVTAVSTYTGRAGREDSGSLEPVFEGNTALQKVI